MKESLASTKVVTTADKAADKRLVEKYNKKLRELKSVKDEFKKQTKGKNNKMTKPTSDNNVQKLTTIITIATGPFKAHKAQCTQSTKEINCVKTHLDEVLKEIKENKKKIINVEEIKTETKEVLREETAKTRDGSKKRLQHTERGLADVKELLTDSTQQIKIVSGNVTNILNMISAGILRPNILFHKNMEQETDQEPERW